MALPPTKEAAAIVLDLSPSMAAMLPTARTVCTSLLQQKLLFAQSDLLGVVLGGTPGALNRLNTTSPNEYQNLTVHRPVAATDAAYLTALSQMDLGAAGGANFDMLDSLVVAADLIHEAVEEKKFSRRLFLVASCNGTVRRKNELVTIIDALKKRNVTLVVVGINFTPPESVVPGSEDDWTTLTQKRQNEKVLEFMVEQLGGDSVVVPVSDALSALSALRSKHFAQRTYSRCILDIGDVKFPVVMYVKALTARPPSLKKVTTKGEPVTIDRKYFSVRAPDQEMAAADRVKAYRYGRSVVPFNEVDEAALKFPTERSMSVLGFVPIDQVPHHILQGGSKAVAPLPGDTACAQAFASFVHGMEHLQRAMLVRLVRCANAEPAIGVLFPSAKAARSIMYFAKLPFAEDLRHYKFPPQPSAAVSQAEQQAVDALVDKMSIPASELRPKDTFNPTLQHFYHAVRCRFAAPDAPLAPLPPAVAATCTAWGEPGNVLESLHAQARPERKRVRELFPEKLETAGVKGLGQGKQFWFAKAGGGVALDSYGQPTLKGPKLEDGAPPAALPLHDASGTASPSLTPASDVLKDIASSQTSSAGAAQHVTTVDPVGTFEALLRRQGEDNVDRAVAEMCEVVLQLLKASIGQQFYGRAAAAVVALRAACVREGEPQAFNRFLLNLMLTTQHDQHLAFWQQHVRGGGVGPITQSECEESDVPAGSGDAFLLARQPSKPVVFEEKEDEPSLFDELE